MLAVSTFPNGTRGYALYVDGQQVGAGRVGAGAGEAACWPLPPAADCCRPLGAAALLGGAGG